MSLSQDRVMAFGYSVDLCGNRAVIGAPSFEEGTSGEAIVYDHNGDHWVMLGRIEAPHDKPTPGFGSAVAVFGDRIIVSDKNPSQPTPGRVYVFHENGHRFVSGGEIACPESPSPQGFGTSVALSEDLALIGSPDDPGEVFAYSFNGTCWNELSRIVAPHSIYSKSFGRSIGLTQERAVIATLRCHELEHQGAAITYSWNGTQYQLETIVDEGEDGTQFATSVSLGGPFMAANSISTDAGQCRVYSFTGDHWTEPLTLPRLLGESILSEARTVAIDKDRALIAYIKEDGDIRRGEVSVLQYNGCTWNHAYTVDSSTQWPEEISSRGNVTSKTKIGNGWWRLYGTALPGTLGVPKVSVTGFAEIGNTVYVEFDSSSKVTSPGLLIMARTIQDLDTPWGGPLLIGPWRSDNPRWRFQIKPGRTHFVFPIPKVSSLVGKTVTLQFLQLDPAAKRGVASPRGLEIGFGYPSETNESEPEATTQTTDLAKTS